MNHRVTMFRPAVWLASVAAAVAALTLAPPACAADPAPLAVTLGSGSVVWLEGTSTMHDFESRTGEITVRFRREAEASDPADVAGLDHLIRTNAVAGLEVEIPVASLRSGKSGLDKNLQKTLHADANPTIRYRLAHYSITGADTSAMHADGTLTVAGRERPTSLAARAWRTPQGVWVEGVQTLLMSDFDVKAPTMMLGALKVGDRVTVHYRLLLVPGTGAQSTRTTE
jgi:hypothetical protein